MIYFNNSIAQDLSNLDKKNGYNKFNLESPYNDYKNDIKFLFEGYDKVKYYKYIKSDISMIFGVKVSEINLGFYKGKLYTISIDLGVTSTSEDMRLQSNLMELFGYQSLMESKSSKDKDFDYEWGLQWISQKVLMQLSKYSCMSKTSACETELFLYSKKIQQQIKNDSF